MKKDKITWYSPNLGEDANVLAYGNSGFAILLFPAMTDNADECESNGLIDSISRYIDMGKCKVFAVPGVNFQSWLNPSLTPQEKSRRHLQYNTFIIEEVVPFIFGDCGSPVPIVTCGAAIGAYHAANSFFRRPDVFYGTIAMSGTYNIEHFTGGYYDDNCYFNSPVHYLPNLNDKYWLSFLLSKHHVYILSGQGHEEHPQNAHHLAGVLNSKSIPHCVEIWGPEWGHNWDTWKIMLPHIIDMKF